MTFIDYVAPLFKLKSSSAQKILAWMCSYAEYNTGKVWLTTNQRKLMASELGISNNTITNNLAILKDLKLISGEKGDFTINPLIFWKGDSQTRSKLLKDSELQITFSIG